MKGLLKAVALIIVVGIIAKFGYDYWMEKSTVDRAEVNKFKFCRVQNERMCQSPDGEVVFHFPLELTIDPGDRHVVNDIGITNAGQDPSVLDEYFITIIDDRDFQYRPHFAGPDGYHDGSDKSPALVLGPRAEDRIIFSERLRVGSKAIKTVTLAYRRVGDADYTRGVVSYKEGVFLGSER